MVSTIPTPEELARAQTWLDWARRHAPRLQYERAYLHLRGNDLGLLGYFIQACSEQPAEFARVFAPLLGAERTHPLTLAGEGTLLNLVRNGVGDDWEIFLQWTDQGYVVVAEEQRRPQDTRLREAEARRLLDTLTGGLREAPGLADEAELVQSFYEIEPFQV